MKLKPWYFVTVGLLLLLLVLCIRGGPESTPPNPGRHRVYLAQLSADAQNRVKVCQELSRKLDQAPPQQRPEFARELLKQAGALASANRDFFLGWAWMAQAALVLDDRQNGAAAGANMAALGVAENKNPRVRQLAESLAGKGWISAATPSISQAAVPPAKPTASADTFEPADKNLSAADRLEFETLGLLALQAEQEADAGKRQADAQTFLARSELFLAKHPDEVRIWLLRGHLCVWADRAEDGIEAAGNLKRLGCIESKDTFIHEVMIEISSKGWLQQPAPKQASSEIDHDSSLAAPSPVAAQSADQIQLGLADGLYSRGLRDLAAPEYEKYLNLFPDAPDIDREGALFRLGECDLRLGKVEDAKEAYRILLRDFAVGKFIGPAAFRLADISYAAKDYDAALGYYRKASVRFTEPKVVLAAKYYSARCLEAMNLPSEARVTYEDIVATTGDNPYLEPSRAATARIRSTYDKKDAEANVQPTKTPSAAADSSPASQDQLQGEKFPETRYRLLQRGDIEGWPLSKLRYAINETYARHGVVFADATVQSLFVPLPWYRPRSGFSYDDAEAEFSDIEKANVKLLGDYRDQLTSRSKDAGDNGGPIPPPQSAGHSHVFGYQTPP